MASWNARHRDPLFDSATRSTLERRGKELIGLGLLALARWRR
jgi:DNA segregation ATPase FtsK/SpoIIIE, S-DNA-T family